VTDSLDYITFPLTLTPTEKKKEIKNEVSSEGARNEQIDIINSEIRFYELLWDKQSNRFYRFSSILIPSNSSEPSKKSKIFLSAFDSDLNLIGEKHLEELTTIPISPFFKDGKLWSYVNVEDELGFAVFTFDF
jgi:UV DNA damage repair endonuclease